MRKYAIEAPGTGCRKELSKRKVQWTESSLDKIHEEIEEFVYLKALNGTSLAHLARTFGVSTQEFECVYGDLYRYASGELQDIVKQDTLKYCLKSQQPVAKIWLGKSFGGLIEAGRTVDVEQDASSDGVTINARTIRAADVVLDAEDSGD